MPSSMACWTSQADMPKWLLCFTLTIPMPKVFAMFACRFRAHVSGDEAESVVSVYLCDRGRDLVECWLSSLDPERLV